MRSQSPPTSHRGRATRLAGGLALLSLAGWAVAGLPFIVFPSIDPLPARADVVVVLGPISAQRIAVAERLRRTGVAGAMLWSIPLASRNPLRPEAALVRDCGRIDDLVCRYPSPATTQGEARMLRDEARIHGWRSAIVVTQRSHLVRARMILARCFAGPLTMQPSGEGPYLGWVYQYLYQTSATVKAWLTPGC